MAFDVQTMESDLETLLTDLRRKRQADVLQGKRRTPPTAPDDDQAMRQLQKAYAGVWPAGMTPQQARALGKTILRHFGANGGTPRPFDPQLATVLGMCGRLTPGEICRWKTFNRLPDHCQL